MLQTIVFFLALFMSTIIISRAYDKSDKDFDKDVRYLTKLVACLLWSWLYYLSH